MYPKEFEEIARKHGQKRSELNKGKRESNNLYQVTHPDKSDYTGILGELIAQFVLQQKGIGFKAAAIVDREPLPGPDIIFTVDNQLFKVDVKTTFSNVLMVPVHKHEKIKKLGIHITHYWFINLNQYNKDFNQTFIKFNDVEKWKIQTLFNNVPFYVKEFQ